MRVDTRAGSKDLIAPLKRLGVHVDAGILPAGDVEILGNGPGGNTVLVGVEHKSVEDAVQCMRNGRFAEQLRGMKESFHISWLLIEGRIGSVSGTGIATRRGDKWFTLPGRVTYQEFAAWTQAMCQAGGVLLWRTETQQESVAWLRALEMWWTVKTWEQHRAHLDYYQPPVTGNPFETPTLALRVAACLPHIGSVLAARVAEHFGSVDKIVLATEKDWTHIKGVGKKAAADIVAKLKEDK